MLTQRVTVVVLLLVAALLVAFVLCTNGLLWITPLLPALLALFFIEIAARTKSYRPSSPHSLRAPPLSTR